MEPQYGTIGHSHGPHGRCSGGHVLGPGNGGVPRAVLQGDLVQSRDFHYSVEPAPVYRRPREVAYHPAQAPQVSSSHLSSSGRSRGERSSQPDYGYVEHKASPYHAGTLRSGVRGLPEEVREARVRDEVRGRLDQNYMMVRAQSRLQESAYDRLSHRSDSRNDLLDTDHSVYEHSLYYQPGQYTGFVRTCDGKFVRTNIPQHDFETLDTNFYRNSSQVQMHGTMRRTSKNRHAHSTQGTSGQQEYCCPTREEQGVRPSDQLQQSYATLRGRKWSEKHGSGVGDNYGRVASNFMEDARSVHSLADDFYAGGRSRMQTAKSISRSTDKSLDSLGVEEEDHMPNFPGLASLNLRSDDILATMLKREPPDGKEKPEPPKHHKLETLSRKNSKCDLLESSSNCVVSRTEGPVSCSGSVSGPDSSSLMSGSSAGHSLALLAQPHTPLCKTDSSSSKRDSFSAASKDPTYLDSNTILGEDDSVSERLKDWWVNTH